MICKVCVLPRSRIKVEEEHPIIPLEKVKKMTLTKLASAMTLSAKCSTHSEPLQIYCFSCKKEICRDCTIIGHRDHKMEFSIMLLLRNKNSNSKNN